MAGTQKAPTGAGQQHFPNGDNGTVGINWAVLALLGASDPTLISIVGSMSAAKRSGHNHHRQAEVPLCIFQASTTSLTPGASPLTVSLTLELA